MLKRNKFEHNISEKRLEIKTSTTGWVMQQAHAPEHEGLETIILIAGWLASLESSEGLRFENCIGNPYY